MSVCFRLFEVEPLYHEGYWYEIMHTNSLPRSMKRGANRQRRKLEKFPHEPCEASYGITDNLIYVKDIAYRQGWFLKNRFFKKPYTTVVCTTRSEMESFFKKYIDYKNKDTRGKECVDLFRSKWEDGMIFICSW